MDPKLLEIRKKLRDDYGFYAKYALKIRTKAGEILPFTFNEAQTKLDKVVRRQLRKTGKVRVIILKARQMGLSTYVGGSLYHQASQREAVKALVVAHKSDSTKALFDMTKRFHANVPDPLKPSTKYSSRRELSFDVLDSSYVVATAGGDGVARGETIQLAHLSELAFWPPAEAAENFNAIYQAIPDSPGTIVFIESTANGMSGPFYELWQGAVSGENEFEPVFLPWFTDPNYRREVPKDFERTPEEEELVEAYKLDDAQLMFRRKRIAAGGRDLFKQEYPSNADEAFLTSGRPVFDPEWVVDAIRNAPDPKYRMALEGNDWEKHSRGELAVYREHDPEERYCIGADVAMGVRDGDYSVAQILDSKKRQVAVWRGHIHPDFFATILKALGEYYNNALVCPENNNHGILTCVRLYKDLDYPYVYIEQVHDKIVDKDTVNIGFRTTVKSKPMVIDQLRAAIRKEEIHIYDKTTLREMQSYIVTESGKLEAEEGCFDDCVMAMALANYVHEGDWQPVSFTDEHYIEAI